MKSDTTLRLRAMLSAGACITTLMAIQLATPAAASTIDLTFTGSIDSGVDSLKQFGGGDLTNDTYVASYVFDSSRGQLSSKSGGQSLIGDVARGDTDPLVSAMITIYHAGTKVGSLAAKSQKQFENQVATFTTPSGQVNAQAYYFGGATPIMIDNNMNATSVPTMLATNASFGGTPGGYGDSVLEEFAGSKVSERLYLDPTHAAFSTPRSTRAAFAVLDAASLPDGLGASAAPEPGTWALMVMAIGMAGAALRRRARASCPWSRAPAPAST